MSIAKRSALVTGGTDGIGKEVARGLALRGVCVIIVGRDPAKGSRAAREIADSSGNPNVEFIAADLSLMREVRRLADAVAARVRDKSGNSELHYLVHCAGIVMGRHTMTAEGIEANFAVNYLSRFLLTSRLLPLLEAGGKPGCATRVLMAGGAARNGKIYFDDVNLTANFATLRAVARFCQANDIFTVELAKRLAASESAPGLEPRVTISCLKIGVVKTGIRKTFPLWMKILVPLVIDPLLAQTPSEVAGAALHLLTDQGLEGQSGGLFLKIWKLRRIPLSLRVADAAAGERLWTLSERLSGGK